MADDDSKPAAFLCGKGDCLRAYHMRAALEHIQVASAGRETPILRNINAAARHGLREDQ